MKLALKNIGTKFILLLLAVQIFNQSMDAIQFHPFKHPDTISDFNYLNSMVEYITEIIMDHKDAFPEYLKKSSRGSQNVKHIDIKLCQSPSEPAITKHFDDVTSFGFPLYNSYFYLFSKEINPPPPKV